MRRQLRLCFNVLLLPCAAAGVRMMRQLQQSTNTSSISNGTLVSLFPPCLSSFSNFPCLAGLVEPLQWNVTLVQVTPSECANHRDGAWMASQLLGTLKYVSVVAGSWSDDNYLEKHQSALTALLDELDVDYIVGTCHSVAQVEPQIAKSSQTILLAQSQSSTLYSDDNPFVFGVALNSDHFPNQFIQALLLDTPTNTSIHLMYPTTSEIYTTMCQTAYESLVHHGFSSVHLHAYSRSIVQDFCIDSEHPVLFICATELLELPCRPRAVWMPQPPALPYLIGAVQGHRVLPFGDNFFDSTEDFWNSTELQFGYPGNYDQVVSYAIPHLAANHYAYHTWLQSPLLLYQSLPSFSTDTLMGPIRFDSSQRNIGRESVTIQWQANVESVVVAPSSLAQTWPDLVAPSAIPCLAGYFWDTTAQTTLLESACAPCPIDTYSPHEGQSIRCLPCSTSTSTLGQTGQSHCFAFEDYSVSSQVLLIGYVAIAVSWAVSMAGLALLVEWTKGINRMIFLYCGSILSSAAVLSWSLQVCQVVPFLYIGGWMMQSWVLTNMREWAVAAFLVDMGLAAAWTIVNPLVYEVEQIDETSLDGEVITLGIAGQCSSQDPEGISGWAFGGAILGLHGLWIGVLTLLTLQRNEQCIGVSIETMASGVMLETIMLGVPIMVAVRDSPTGIYVVLIVCICIHNIFLIGIFWAPKLFPMEEKEEAVVENTEIEARPQNDRTMSFRFKRQPSSQWDQAVCTINELLKPNINLSVDQKERLESIRSMLMQQGDSRSEKILHLPLLLIRKGLVEAVKTGVNQSLYAVKAVHNLSALTMAKPVNQISETARFILKEFGGITTASPSDYERIRAISEVSEDFELDQMEFVLPEYISLSRENQMRLFRLLSWSSLKRWEFNVFDLLEITNGKNPLLLVGWAILGAPHAQYSMARQCGVVLQLEELRGYNFADENLRIPIEKLCDYLRVIEQDYKDTNPYHNPIHAADVVQTMHTLIQMIGDSFPTNKVDIFSILLSAVVHDVKHPGENNTFQANARTDLALLYNDHSILENRHISHAFQVMLGDEDPHGWRSPPRRLSHVNHGRVSSLNLLCNVQPEQLKSIRSKMIDAVLHTDMSKHFASVSSMKALVMNYTEKAEMDEESSWKVLCFMLHLADISNPAKPDPLFKVWADRCLEEFFAQGDKEKVLRLPVSPNCDRATTKKAACQLGFITYVVFPAYEVLATILEPVEQRILPVIKNNTEFWKGEEEKSGESTTEQ